MSDIEMIEITYRGFTAKQLSSGNVFIYEVAGDLVLYTFLAEQADEQKLKDIIDFYIEIAKE